MTDISIFNKDNIISLYFALLGLILPISILFAQQALPIYLVILTITALISGWGKAKISLPAVSLCAIFCLYILASSLWSEDINFSAFKAVRIIAITSCAVILLTYGGKIPRKNLNTFATLLLISTVLLAILVGLDTYTNVMQFLFPDKKIHYFIKPGSALIALCTFLLTYKFLGARLYVSLILGALTILVAMHISVTNTSIAALLVGLIASLYLVIFKSKSSSIYSIPMVSLIVLSPLLLKPDMILLALDTGANISTSLLHRFAIWNFAIENIWNAPLIGHGIASSSIIEGGKDLVTASSLPPAFTDFSNWKHIELTGKAELLPLHPHNMGIQLYLELGVIGVILAACLIWQAFNYARLINNRLLTVALVILFIINQSGFSIWQSWWMSFQILVIFAVIQFAKPSDQTKE